MGRSDSKMLRGDQSSTIIHGMHMRACVRISVCMHYVCMYVCVCMYYVRMYMNALHMYVCMYYVRMYIMHYVCMYVCITYVCI